MALPSPLTKPLTPRERQGPAPVPHALTTDDIIGKYKKPLFGNNSRHQFSSTPMGAPNTIAGFPDRSAEIRESRPARPIQPASAYADRPKSSGFGLKAPASWSTSPAMGAAGAAGPAGAPAQQMTGRPFMADGINDRVAAAMPAAEQRNGFNMATGAISPTASGLPMMKPTAPAVKPPAPGLSPAKKFAAGMERQKSINQGVAASMGLQVDKAGNQTGRIGLPPPVAPSPVAAAPSSEMVGPPMPAGMQPGGAATEYDRRNPLLPPPSISSAPGNTQGYSSAAVTAAATGGLNSQRATGGRLGTMQMSGGGKGPRAEDNPEAFAKFAADKTGGLEWKNDVNGPKRGRRVVGGPYNGMTQEQVQAALASEFQNQ